MPPLGLAVSLRSMAPVSTFRPSVLKWIGWRFKFKVIELRELRPCVSVPEKGVVTPCPRMLRVSDPATFRTPDFAPCVTPVTFIPDTVIATLDCEVFVTRTCTCAGA